MAVLKNNEYRFPFWGAKNTFITGLDPLGLQNTSEATFTFLLPGITNLTNRIRYYGFYCWLLDYYAREIRHTDPKIQYNFIRRAELMIALLMQTEASEVTQVTGSNFASKLIDQEANPYYDLEEGADKNGDRKTYWKFSSGAFGQYYAGALQDIGLVTKNEDGNFICTMADAEDFLAGEQLAQIFAAGIPEAIRRRFLSIVDEGKLPKNEIPGLFQHFSLKNIPVESAEWQAYKQLLFQKDLPLQEEREEMETFLNRRKTLLHFLSFIGEQEELQGWEGFTRTNYQTQGRLFDEEGNTLRLWYFYQLNEYWHYGAGALFWGMLHLLEQEFQVAELSRFVRHFTGEIAASLEEIHGIDSGGIALEHFIHLTRQSEEEYAAQIHQAVKQKDALGAAVGGIELLMKIVDKNQGELETLQELTNRYGVLRDGDVLSFLNEVLSKQEVGLKEFLKDFMLRHLIYRHQYVAYRKTGSGMTTTLKFLLEENLIRHLENFEPRFTSPRLSAVLHMFEDLHLITGKKELTGYGRRLATENRA